jgi:hypothetical protein
MYTWVLLLVSVNTKIETYKLENILIFTDTFTGQEPVYILVVRARHLDSVL